MRVEYVRSYKQAVAISQELSRSGSIVLVGINSKEGGEEVIFDALRNNRKVIGVRYINFRPEKAIIKSIVNFLIENSAVKTLEIALPINSSASLEASRAIKEICYAIQRNRTITALRIENFNLQDDIEVTEALANMIASADQLQILSFFLCKFVAQDLKIIASGIQRNHGFRVLHLHDTYWNANSVRSSGVVDDISLVIGDAQSKRASSVVLRLTRIIFAYLFAVIIYNAESTKMILFCILIKQMTVTMKNGSLTITLKCTLLRNGKFQLLCAELHKIEKL